MVRSAALTLIGLLCCLTAGCGGNPSAANIKLRKSLQSRDDEITSLRRQHETDLADLGVAHGPAPNSQPISPDFLRKLYTAQGLSLGRLTGGADLHGSKPGHEGLKIYAVPTDDDGQPIKAAGSFVVQAFDLADNGNVVGTWKFDTESARKNWFGSALLYNYILVCPWQSQIPKHSELTVRVVFHDELTGRELTAERAVTIVLPTTDPS